MLDVRKQMQSESWQKEITSIKKLIKRGVVGSKTHLLLIRRDIKRLFMFISIEMKGAFLGKYLCFYVAYGYEKKTKSYKTLKLITCSIFF